ncbi:hypothetical protein KP509_11G022800 [Ceratopteris richardii]|uniref:Myeloid leukemia factor 1 n=1 Tax=Ceratopteris richardii TaxID=49495 RepID=A0A8T2TSQ6_CERRI|nr:hypothetical protein KP509_11G022800 [Ceratopteris richardii]KAH7424764.1 hypothetical protein KP509_11G022800 [Ceratopteris richardii]
MQDSRGIRRVDDFALSNFPVISHGFGNRNSLFKDFFEKDPFDDPFFTQPFGFGNRFPSIGDSFESFHTPLARQLDTGVREQQSTRGIVIEELSEEHKNKGAQKSESQVEPIVEHPDDIEVKRVKSVYSSDGPKYFSQSFAFSSVSYGGPQGTYYKSSAMQRGSNGVFEEMHEERDTINGHETNQIVHGLGNKGHAITRKKNASGKEDYIETLHNLTEEEKKEFDDTWNKQAKKYLPGFKSNSAQMMLKNRSSGEENDEAVADSSSTKPTKRLAWRWPWAKKA